MEAGSVERGSREVDGNAVLVCDGCVAVAVTEVRAER